MPRRPQNKGTITVVIFKEVGKVRRFTISPGLVLGASLFLFFYIPASVYFTNKYFDTRRANKIQAERIAELSGDLLKATRNLERAKQHIALVDDYIREGQEQAPELRGGYRESALPGIVGIEDLEIRRNASTISVAFRIVNTRSDEEPVEGYIFVLARAKDPDRSETCIYPSSPVKDGLPVDYRSGYRFSIQNFMRITAELRPSGSREKPLALEILAYDTDGALILQKAVER